MSWRDRPAIAGGPVRVSSAPTGAPRLSQSCHGAPAATNFGPSDVTFPTALALSTQRTLMHRALLALTAVAFVGACGSSNKDGTDTAAGNAPAARSSASSGADLTGAGATFPYPLYSKWFDA